MLDLLVGGAESRSLDWYWDFEPPKGLGLDQWLWFSKLTAGGVGSLLVSGGVVWCAPNDLRGAPSSYEASWS